MKTYVGRPESAEYAHVGDVFVVDETGKQKLLNPRHDLCNHSPCGFAWGYAGSGPSQLALAILADVAGDERALTLYQKFKFAKIGSLPRGAFQITESEVIAWLETQEVVAR